MENLFFSYQNTNVQKHCRKWMNLNVTTLCLGFSNSRYVNGEYSHFYKDAATTWLKLWICTNQLQRCRHYVAEKCGDVTISTK